MAVDEKIIARIKHLLVRTAENGCTQSEAAEALQKASELMAKYTISLEELSDDKQVRESFTEVEIATSSRAKFEFDLAAVICRDHYCVQVIKMADNRGPKPVLRQMFFGTPTHTEAAHWVFHALIAAFDRLWAEYRTGVNATRADRKTFIVGVFDGFNRKLAAERREFLAQQAEQDEAAAIEREALGIAAHPTRKGAGGALALFTAKIEEEFSKLHPKVIPGRRIDIGKGSRGALEAGREAGSKLNLSKPLDGKSAPPRRLPGH